MRLRIGPPIVCLVLGFFVAYVFFLYGRRTCSSRLRCSSIGSTKEEILKMQGKPTAIFGNIWIYKESSVIFDKDGFVNTWCDMDGNFKSRSCSPEENNVFFSKMRGNLTFNLESRKE